MTLIRQETLQFQRTIRTHLDKPDLLLRLDNPDGWKSAAELNSPLALYAAQYLIQYVVSGEVASSSELECPMRSLFQPQSVQFVNWIRLHDIDADWNPT